MPVISASHAALIVEALLHDRPLAGGCNDEVVQINLETICNRIVIDARRKPARSHQRFSIEAATVGKVSQLGRSVK